jgi:hypothetical protein
MVATHFVSEHIPSLNEIFGVELMRVNNTIDVKKNGRLLGQIEVTDKGLNAHTGQTHFGHYHSLFIATVVILVDADIN